MALTDVNTEDRLVQQTFAEHLRESLGWESVHALNAETFGPGGTLGRASERDLVLVRDLRAALERLNPGLPPAAVEQAVEKLTKLDSARSLVQHNREQYGYIRNGVPVQWHDDSGETRHAQAQVIDFRKADNNRFLAVRDLGRLGVFWHTQGSGKSYSMVFFGEKVRRLDAEDHHAGRGEDLHPRAPL